MFVVFFVFLDLVRINLTFYIKRSRMFRVNDVEVQLVFDFFLVVEEGYIVFFRFFFFDFSFRLIQFIFQIICFDYLVLLFCIGGQCFVCFFFGLGGFFEGGCFCRRFYRGQGFLGLVSFNRYLCSIFRGGGFFILEGLSWFRYRLGFLQICYYCLFFQN